MVKFETANRNLVAAVLMVPCVCSSVVPFRRSINRRLKHTHGYVHERKRAYHPVNFPLKFFRIFFQLFEFQALDILNANVIVFVTVKTDLAHMSHEMTM